MLDLRKLFIDVFDPQPDELAGVMIDVPHGAIADNAEWRMRREMAVRWHKALCDLGADRGFTVLPVIEFNATGGNNAQLPDMAVQSSSPIALADIASGATLLLAMTEFSASAPLIGWTKHFPKLRAASMPRVAPEMEASALAADYALVARSCGRLRDRLAAASMADIDFSTGDRLRFDFRFREAEVDDGQLRRDASPPRLINLPSGEAFVAAYEGEKGPVSETSGTLPIPWGGEIVRVSIEENRVREVLGDTSAANNLREFLFADRARCNVAELGLGCNPKARVWGNVLEDEKAGPHIALGRSEHLGGSVGPDAFSAPQNVWHEDFVYARGCPVEIAQLTLRNEAGGSGLIFSRGSYAVGLETGI